MIFQSFGDETDWCWGIASSNKAADPQRLITHSGASRSVSPLRLRNEIRFCEERNSGSESW